MLISNGDMTFTGGPLDVIIILEHEGRFHPAFFEEMPPPGPVKDVMDVKTVRLQSRMHHTTGFATLEEAQENVREELGKKILLTPDNIQIERPVKWDGDLALVILVNNWKQAYTVH